MASHACEGTCCRKALYFSRHVSRTRSGFVDETSTSHFCDWLIAVAHNMQAQRKVQELSCVFLMLCDCVICNALEKHPRNARVCVSFYLLPLLLAYHVTGWTAASGRQILSANVGLDAFCAGDILLYLVAYSNSTIDLWIVFRNIVWRRVDIFTR